MEKRGLGFLWMVIIGIVVLGGGFLIYNSVRDDPQLAPQCESLSGWYGSPQCEDGHIRQTWRSCGFREGGGSHQPTGLLVRLPPGCTCTDSTQILENCGDNNCTEGNPPTCNDPVNETHSICSNSQCISIEGNGTDMCSTNSDCSSGNETQPDLVIINMSANVNSQINVTNKSGQNHTIPASVNILVTIKNIGTASTVTTSRTLLNVSSFGPRNIMTPILGPNQKVIVQGLYTPISQGNYEAYSSADNLYEIDESNENNNMFGPITFFVP